jgi:hypothetical protein
MWRFVAAGGFAALALVGCSPGSERLYGRWRGTRAEGVAADMQAAANAFATRMQIDVSGDVMVVTTAGDKQNCHYKTVREDKGKVVITTDKDGPKEEQTFTFDGPKTMRWAVTPDGKSIVFVKTDDAK